MDFSTLAVLCALSLITVLLSQHVFGRHAKDLPTPTRYFLIGNYLSSSAKPWRAFKQWGRELGPVFCLRILGLDIVVLSTVGAAREFQEVRSHLYSGRRAPKMVEMIGMCEGLLFQPNVTRLRQGRKLLASALQPAGLKAYQPVLHRNIILFLSRVLASPSDILDLVPTLSSGLALEISYGYQATGLDDPFVHRARTTIDRFAKATAYSFKEGFLVNWIPFLAKLPSCLPGMSFKRLASEWDRAGKSMAEEGFNAVKTGLRNGTARPSLLQKTLEMEDGAYEDIVLMRTAFQVYSGASDTSSSALLSFVLAMTRHPDVQARAQAEIDHHMVNKGAGRLPSYEKDREDLPYVMAIMREVIRRNPPVPIPTRTAAEDDLYEGCLVKKGTMIMVNVWGMLNDEAIFPDYDTFRPERWLDGSILDKYDADSLDIGFGFGRRVCPGKHLAIDVLFTAAASLLAVFNISRARDADGNEIVPGEVYVPHAIIAPQPFPCVVTPRSKAAEQLVDDAMSALG